MITIMIFSHYLLEPWTESMNEKKKPHHKSFTTSFRTHFIIKGNL